MRWLLLRKTTGVFAPVVAFVLIIRG